MKKTKITEFSAADLDAIALPDDWVGARSGAKQRAGAANHTATAKRDAAGAGAATAAQNDAAAGVRLQKALASAGVASRRACETLITRGRVRVNGQVVWELGTKITPGADEVRVDGVVVQLDVTQRYFIFNKPVGVVSSMSDDKGRRDLREFTAAISERVYNVGRLDYDTSGLLILTNDGELAHKLAHPKFEVAKTYLAQVRGKVTPATIQRLKTGFELEDGFIKADHAKALSGASERSTLVEITLHSGRNRIVRRMLAAVGHPVLELHRKQFGPLHLGTLRTGEIRELAAAERGALLTAAQAAATGKQPGAKKRQITAGRPGDGAGAQGMRGVARSKPRAGKVIKRGGQQNGAQQRQRGGKS